MPDQRLMTKPPPLLQEQGINDRPFHLKPHVARTLPGLRGVWTQNHPDQYQHRIPVTGLNTLWRTEQLLSIDETRHKLHLDRFEDDAWRLEYQDRRWIDHDELHLACRDKPVLLLALADATPTWTPTLDFLVDGLLMRRDDLRLFVLPDPNGAELTGAQTTERLRAAPAEVFRRAEVLPPPTTQVTMPAPYYVTGFAAAAQHGLLKTQRQRTSILICMDKGPQFGSEPACIAVVVDGSESSARAVADAVFLSREGDSIQVILVVQEHQMARAQLLQAKYAELFSDDAEQAGNEMTPEARWMKRRLIGRNVQIQTVVLAQESFVFTACQQASECNAALLCIGVRAPEFQVELVMRTSCSVCLAGLPNKNK